MNNSWRTSKSNEMANKDLIKKCIECIGIIESDNGTVHLIKDKGHSDNEGNNMADFFS